MKRRDLVFLNVMRQLSYPPIFLIPPAQFEMLDGENGRSGNTLDEETYGIAALKYPVISVRPDIKGKALLNTIWHEVGHHLWPWRPHWWIDLFGEIMAGGGGRGHWAKTYNKELNELPPRKKLLRMAQRQAEKLKVMYQIE